MRTILILTLTFVGNLLQAQHFDCAKDIEFLVERYTRDYSGMRDFKQKNPGFLIHSDSVKIRSNTAKSIDDCEAIIKSVIDYLNNKHVFYGSTIKNPQYKEEEEPVVVDIPVMISYPSKNSVYLKVSSSDLMIKDTLEQVIRSNEGKIKASNHLIIDVRGNGGGSDAVLNTLLPYIYTNPIVSHNLELWSSKNNIKLFEDLLMNEYISGEDKETIRKIIIKAKEYPDQFISLTDQKADTIRFSKVLHNPKHVSILIDEKCMSATENFLLKAKQSSKVKIYGHSATAGGVDYGDLNFVTLPSGYWFISVPTTRSTRLPLQVTDNIGISPDVTVDKNSDLLKLVQERHK